MNVVAILITRVLDAIDALFDAAGAILRVLFRGAFASDAKSYRGSRFAALDLKDVLTQEIALNAGDAAQARKAVALDPDRHLPLSLDAAAFDIIGPVDPTSDVRTRPERRYVIGLVRAEALARCRAELPASKRAVVEAFVHAPAAQPSQALVFRDAAGSKRQRTRRVLLLAALALFALTGSAVLRAGRAALDQAATDADAERVTAERRVRLAERRVAAAREALSAVQTSPSPTLTMQAARLARFAAHQPLQTETLTVEIEGRRIRFAGRTHEALEAELALRRAFEGEAITFAADNDAPAAFTAELGAPTIQEAQR